MISNVFYILNITFHSKMKNFQHIIHNIPYVFYYKKINEIRYDISKIKFLKIVLLRYENLTHIIYNYF